MLKRIGLNAGLIVTGITFLLPLRPTVAFGATNISNCTELMSIIDQLGEDYVLTQDIDCEGYSFTPIGYYAGNVYAFYGTFNGNGHVIRGPDIGGSLLATGLFAATNGATIQNVRITGADVFGEGQVGVLIGLAENTIINNVGIENFTVDGDGDHIGGAVGNLLTSTIRRVYASGGTIDGEYKTGGLIGYWDSSTGSNLYVRGSTVTTTVDDVGGLIGEMHQRIADGTLTNAYTDATVSGVQSVGGLIGHMTYELNCVISNTFATGIVDGALGPGGLVGEKEDGCDIINSAYNDTSDNPDSCVGMDGDNSRTACTKITDDLSYFYDYTHAPLSSWDYTDTWLHFSDDFPWLSFQPSHPVSNVTVSVSGNTVIFTWTNPTESDFSSVTIRSAEGSYPAYETSDDAVASGITDTTYTATSVPDGTYYYSLFAKDTSDAYATAAHAFAVVDTRAISANVCSAKAYYSLNTVGTSPVAVDDSGNGYDGTLYGTGTVTLSSDVPATGLLSNPESYLFTASHRTAIKVARPVQDDFTMCLWFKTTTAGTYTHHYDGRMLLDAEVPFASNDFGLGVNSSNKLVFGNGNGFSDYNITGSSTVTDGAWKHACVTRKKSTGEIRIYLNGELDVLGYGSTTSLTSPTYLVIGGPQDGGSYWNGNIDDVRIYDSILNGSEIRSIANGSAACFSSSSSSAASSTSSSAPVEHSGGGRRGSPGRGGSAALLSAVYSSTISSKNAHSSAPSKNLVPLLEGRTCDRVMKWFKNNTVMLERVNARLEKRFGFTCAS